MPIHFFSGLCSRSIFPVHFTYRELKKKVFIKELYAMNQINQLWDESQPSKHKFEAKKVFEYRTKRQRYKTVYFIEGKNSSSMKNCKWPNEIKRDGKIEKVLILQILIYRNNILHLLQNLYKKCIFVYKIFNEFESLGKLTLLHLLQCFMCGWVLCSPWARFADFDSLIGWDFLAASCVV